MKDFNIHEFVAHFEEKTKQKVNDGLIRFLKDAEPLLQVVYEAGYHDGLEARA